MFWQIDFSDPTYTGVGASIWSTTEQAIGIICACLSTMQALVRRLRSKLQEQDCEASGRSKLLGQIQMPHLQSEGAIGLAQNAGFTHLDEEDASAAYFATCVTTTRPSAAKIGTEGVYRDQTIEQHHRYLNQTRGSD